MITVKKLTYMGQAVAKRRRPREGPKKRRSLLNKMNNFFSNYSDGIRLQTSDFRLQTAQGTSPFAMVIHSRNTHASKTKTTSLEAAPPFLGTTSKEKKPGATRGSRDNRIHSAVLILMLMTFLFLVCDIAVVKPVPLPILDIEQMSREEISRTEHNHYPTRTTTTPPEITSTLQQNYEQCRKHQMNIFTHSISEFCIADAASDFDNLDAQFDLIELSLAPFSYIFDQEKLENSTEVSMVVPNILCHREEHIQSTDITLTTQISVNKMGRLGALAGRWNGPVSVAIRITSLDELHQLKNILSDNKNQQHLQKVAFHLYIDNNQRDYPVNTLRNIALDQVKSDYFALFDVDLLPSPMNTHQHLRTTFQENPDLLNKLNDKTIFVLPAWQLERRIAENDIGVEHSMYPENRDMVLAMNAEKVNANRKINMFWHKSSPSCQRSTNFEKWTSKSVEISYPIHIKEFGFEPYSIGAVKDNPRFFPCFRGFDYNKISYYVELHYAQYQMEALRDYFVFHVPHPFSFRKKDSKARNREWRGNKRCARTFVKHLEKVYGADHFGGVDKEVPGWSKWRQLAGRKDK